MNLGLSPLSIGGKKSLPLMKQLEANMLAAVKQAGGAAWYVPDDFLVLGPELIPDGAFSSSAGWTLGTGWSITGGKLVATSAATSTNAVINAGLVAGKSYLITYDIDSITAGASTPIANGATSTQQTTSGQKVGIITPLGSSGNIGFSSSSATALTAVIDNFSVREILSAKDWQDASGTLPSYLTGTVGLLTDRSYNGELGPELVSTWAAQNAATISSTNTLPVTCTAAVSGDNGVFIAGPPAGKQYAVSVAWSGNDEGRTIQVRVGSAYTSLGSSVSGSATIIAYADNTNNLIVRAASSAVGDTYTITAFSVRELKGVHASQATSGNRPTITRIPRKLGPEMLQSVSISGTNGTNTGSATGNSFTINQVDSTSVVTATLSIRAPSAGKSYLVSATPSGLSGNSFKVDSPAWLNGPTTVSAGFVLTAPASPSAQIQIYRVGFPAVGTYSNISVREVLEWSYALTFDGTNDSLAAPASIIGSDLSQPYTMIAWGRVGAIGAGRRMIGENVRQLGIDSTGKATIGHNAGAVTGTTTLSQGQLVILEATYNGSTCELKLNNAVEYSGPIVAPAGTVTATMVGQSGASAAYWNDQIGGAIICPAVMTDAQRAAVRKFAAALMGLSL